MKPTPTRRAARAVPVLLTLLAGCSSGTTSGAPDETKSRTVVLKPNGTDGSCVFKAFTKQAIWDFFKGM